MCRCDEWLRLRPPRNGHSETSAVCYACVVSLPLLCHPRDLEVNLAINLDELRLAVLRRVSSDSFCQLLDLPHCFQCAPILSELLLAVTCGHLIKTDFLGRNYLKRSFCIPVTLEKNQNTIRVVVLMNLRRIVLVRVLQLPTLCGTSAGNSIYTTS